MAFKTTIIEHSFREKKKCKDKEKRAQRKFMEGRGWSRQRSPKSCNEVGEKLGRQLFEIKRKVYLKTEGLMSPIAHPLGLAL